MDWIPSTLSPLNAAINLAECMCAEDAENEGLARRLGKVSRIPKLTKPILLLLFFLLFSITQLRSKANLHPEECIRYGQKNFQKSLLFQIWDLEWGLLWVRNGGNTLIFFFFFCLMFSYSLFQPRQFPSVGKDGGSRQVSKSLREGILSLTKEPWSPV